MSEAPGVLVIGDLMLDVYLRGECTRISPEAPVPVIHDPRTRSALGGAGNVAANVAALGGSATLSGVIGDASVRALVSAVGVADRLVVDPSRPTTTKTRVIAGTQQIVRIDDECTEPISDAVAEQIRAVARQALPETAVLILSDYRKGVLRPDLLQALIDDARQQGVAVLVDPKGDDVTRYRGATVLTPNLSEARQALGQRAPPEALARPLLDSAEADAVAITCGARGIYLYQRRGGGVWVPTAPRAVFDVVGAGDTVVAAMGVMLGEGRPLREAVHLANQAAGLAVSLPGTAVVRREQLAGGLLSLSEAAALAAQARRNGHCVAVTNGCFDLLHPGHLATLEQARQHGELVIVLLNSDASVRALKGAARPVQDQATRARMLLALSAVDVVVIFEGQTPSEELRVIRPTVLLKGGDYTPEQIAGAAFAEQVVIVPRLPRHSTTATIARASVP